MTAPSLITLDPASTSGHRTVIQGTSWSVVSVLRHLATGITEEQLVGEFQRSVTPPHRPLISADVRAAVAHAASACRVGSLSPPAKEAFLREREGYSLSREAARQAADWAVPVLELMADGKSPEEILDVLPDLSRELLHGALWWGAAAVYDQSAAAAGLTAERDASLRELLDGNDRKLVDDYYHYVCWPFIESRDRRSTKVAVT